MLLSSNQSVNGWAPRERPCSSTMIGMREPLKSKALYCSPKPKTRSSPDEANAAGSARWTMAHAQAHLQLAYIGLSQKQLIWHCADLATGQFSCDCQDSLLSESASTYGRHIRGWCFRSCDCSRCEVQQSLRRLRQGQTRPGLTLPVNPLFIVGCRDGQSTPSGPDASQATRKSPSICVQKAAQGHSP